jgi:hypothetical protein
MKKFLLSACAAALIATVASSASAGQFTMSDNGPAGPIIGAGDDRYYDDNGYNGNDWRYRSPGYGDEDSDYGNQSYGNGYGNSYGNGYGNSYGNGYGNSYGNGYGNGYNGYGNGGYGYGYGNYRVLPPRVIVRYLYRSGFSYISQPALAGQFYQIKARDPNGRKVKLYVDAYNGRIVKVKKH